MVWLITGASHTGKTVLAQRILEKHHVPYLSIDHLKMGLIRSGNTTLTPLDDEALTEYLWPIVREIVKTAVENRQNLVVEGGYIPFGWDASFTEEYRRQIKYCCLVMSERYIENHFAEIKKYAGVIENRGDDSDCTRETVLQENRYFAEMCRKYGYQPILLEEEYRIDLESIF
jgi:adenylate kinase family enzyme